MKNPFKARGIPRTKEGYILAHADVTVLLALDQKATNVKVVTDTHLPASLSTLEETVAHGETLSAALGVSARAWINAIINEYGGESTHISSETVSITGESGHEEDDLS